MMEVTIREEAGFSMALYGLSLSFKDRAIPFEQWWTTERKEKLRKTVKGLCTKDGGHNKFLEAITVWIDIEAPRYWWSEFDTYRVGMTKQSESTMHTVLNRELDIEDFSRGKSSYTNGLLQMYINSINGTMDIIRELDKKDQIREIKRLLPDSYLQRRLVVTNYKSLRNIFLQRRNHKLAEWQIFCHEIKAQVKHPELLPVSHGSTKLEI